MIEGVGFHAFHNGDVIDDFRQMRQDFRDFCPAFPMFCKFKFRAEELRIRINKRGPIPFQQVHGGQLTVEFAQHRFIIKELQVAGASPHKQEDDIFCLGRMVGLMRCQGILNGTSF